MADIDKGTPFSVNHPNELKKRNATYVNFELKQMGVGGIDGWNGIPLDDYLIPYNNYAFNFIIRPLK
jgi:beta-galactosidase